VTYPQIGINKKNTEHNNVYGVHCRQKPVTSDTLDRCNSFKNGTVKKKILLILIPIVLILTATIMDKTRKETWFEGSNNLQTDLPKMKESLDDIGQYFKGVISLMPGMTDVKLVDQGNDFVSIQTNEEIMKRTNILVKNANDKISIEFDEEYQAGKMVTATSHFLHKFRTEENTINHSLVISSLKAPGLMGFFYRNFGSKNIGKAFLGAHKQYLEK
jgi:hypothetical protein